MPDYRRISRTQDGVNLNALGVYDTYNRIDFNIHPDQGDLAYSNIFVHQRQSLVSILKNVLNSEQKFYALIGVKNIYELQERIDLIEHSGISILSNSRWGEVVAQLRRNGYDFSVTRTDTEQIMITDTLNKLAENDPDFQQVVENYAQDQTEENLLAVFNSLSTKRFLSTKDIIKLPEEFIKRMGGKEGQNAGLYKSIVLHVSIENGVPKLTIDWVGASSRMIKKLYKITKTALDNFNQKAGASQQLSPLPTDKNQIIDALWNAISPFLHDPQIKPIVEQEMMSQSSRMTYDVNRSISSIIGYLGEVHLNVLLKILLGDKNATVQNTGNLRDTVKNEEIGIDTILNGYGFQVKNYNIINGRLSFDDKHAYTGSMSSLMSRMMGDLPMHYDQMIAELYGTVQFNQPYNPQDNPENDTYNECYEQMKTLAKGDAIEYFRYNIDRISRIDQAFSVKDHPIFGNTDLYFNTFFFVDKKLVPSSAILKTIIRVLDNKINESAYRFQMKVKFEQQPNYYTSIIEPSANGVRPDVPTLFGNSGILSHIGVQVDYSFDLQTILSEALQSISITEIEKGI